jgi:hypothetical protein
VIKSRVLTREIYSGLSKQALNAVTSDLIRGRHREIWDTHKESDVNMETDTAEVVPRQGTLRNVGCHLEDRRDKQWLLNQSLHLTSWFWTSGLQKCNRINFHFLSHEDFDSLLQQSWEMNTFSHEVGGGVEY